MAAVAADRVGGLKQADIAVRPLIERLTGLPRGGGIERVGDGVVLIPEVPPFKPGRWTAEQRRQLPHLLAPREHVDVLAYRAARRDERPQHARPPIVALAPREERQPPQHAPADHRFLAVRVAYQPGHVGTVETLQQRFLDEAAHALAQ